MYKRIFFFMMTMILIEYRNNLTFNGEENNSIKKKLNEKKIKGRMLTESIEINQKEPCDEDQEEPVVEDEQTPVVEDQEEPCDEDDDIIIDNVDSGLTTYPTDDSDVSFEDENCDETSNDDSSETSVTVSDSTKKPLNKNKNSQESDCTKNNKRPSVINLKLKRCSRTNVNINTKENLTINIFDECCGDYCRKKFKNCKSCKRRK